MVLVRSRGFWGISGDIRGIQGISEEIQGGSVQIQEARIHEGFRVSRGF